MTTTETLQVQSLLDVANKLTNAMRDQLQQATVDLTDLRFKYSESERELAAEREKVADLQRMYDAKAVDSSAMVLYDEIEKLKRDVADWKRMAEHQYGSWRREFYGSLADYDYYRAIVACGDALSALDAGEPTEQSSAVEVPAPAGHILSPPDEDLAFEQAERERTEAPYRVGTHDDLIRAKEYRQKWIAAVKFMANAPVESGVCCCGDSIEGHSAEHTATDMWGYAVWKFVEEMEADALEAKAGKEKSDE